MPLNGRHVFNLVKVVVGVVPRWTRLRQPVLSHNEISVVSIADGVQEFCVETNAIKPEFGQTAGERAMARWFDTDAFHAA